jgi:hypothetical protein
MGLPSRRRNLVVWSQSARPVARRAVPPKKRRRRTRRWLRTGTLLTVVGLRPFAHAAAARWRRLLAAAVLTVIVVVVGGGPGGVIILLLVAAPFVLAGPRKDRIRRSELERELGVYAHPVQRRLAVQAMDLHDHAFPVAGRY